MPNSQVAALLRRARDGDADAFEQLVEPHLGRLYNYIARLIGDPADAEDLTQEVLLRVHRALGSFRGGASFQTWLYRIATNLVVDAMRQRSRERARVSSLDDPLQAQQGELAREIPDTEREPWERTQAAELSEVVQDAIQSLSPKLRSVVVLFDIQGLTYEEIAETLRVPLGTVKSRLFNARCRLRELLLPYVAGSD